jgi:outer membrane protein insertion porin family
MYTSIKKIKHFLIVCYLLVGFAPPALGTTDYTIRTVQVVGNAVVDHDVIIALSRLQEGATINTSSRKVHEAIRKIAKHDMIKSVAIYLSDVDDTKALASCVIKVEEHPQLTDYCIEGLTKKEKKALFETITIPENVSLSPLFLYKKAASIKKYFLEKGFREVQVSMELVPNKEIAGKATLNIKVNKGTKNVVNKITFEGNNHLDTRLLIHNMKELKEAPHFTLFKDVVKKIVTLAPIRKGGVLLQLPKTIDDVINYFLSHVSLFSSFFTEEKYLKAKKNLILFYQSKGFRDMRIVEEQLQHSTTGKLNIHLKIEEGKQYVIRHVKWVGNYLHSAKKLNVLLKLQAGKIYDPLYISRRLNPGTTDLTIADLYTNNGYIFFRAEAVETGIEDNQVDLEIRIHEGKQATIHKIDIVGNTMTHDYVIRRELATLPGEKYNRGRVLESLQNLAMLDFFKPEKLIPEIHPDEARGTVDLTYQVVEQPKWKL